MKSLLPKNKKDTDIGADSRVHVYMLHGVFLMPGGRGGEGRRDEGRRGEETSESFAASPRFYIQEVLHLC